MAVPIRRKIPPKAFQKIVTGILFAGGIFSAIASVVIVLIGGWNPEDGFILVLAGMILVFFIGMGYALKAIWEGRERAALEKGEKIPEEA